MQDDEDSTDSQETTVTQSWLHSDKTPLVENEEADQEQYEWDDFQEEPSYLEISVSSAQESLEADTHTRRQSSTTDNLLEASPRQVVQPFVFSTNPAEPYSAWPPRNPSSEPDFFAESLLPTDLLDAVNESEEFEEVFFDTNIEFEDTMPPKTPPNPQTLYQDFKKKVEEWEDTHEEALELGETLPKGMMEDLTTCCKTVEKLC